MPDREQRIFKAVIVKPDGRYVGRTIVVTPVTHEEADRLNENPIKVSVGETMSGTGLIDMADIGLREATPDEISLGNARRSKKIMDRQSRLSRM